MNTALEVYICYNKLLFSTYNKKNLLLICTANYAKLIVLRKKMVTLNLLLNGKPDIVNFCNVFYTSELEYNFLLIDIIKKTDY